MVAITFDYEPNQKDVKWFYTEDRINQRNEVQLRYKPLARLIKTIPFNLDHIVRLKINFNNPIDQVDLAFLGKLALLEHLELSGVCPENFTSIPGNDCIRLVLPTVKTLKLELSIMLMVDAPNLRNLFYRSLLLETLFIEWVNPLTIKHLHVKDCVTRKLNQYANLEYFEFDKLQTVNADVFTLLPNLTELHLNGVVSYSAGLLNVKMNQLIEGRMQCGRPVRLFFNKRELIGGRRFEDYQIYCPVVQLDRFNDVFYFTNM